MKCLKCDHAAKVVIRHSHYCRDCFLNASFSKFKQSIGRVNSINQDSKVLLAFSGSVSSVLMLNYCIRKKMDVVVCHVNENILNTLDHSNLENKDERKFLSGFPFKIVYKQISLDDLTMYNQCSTYSSKEDLTRLFLNRKIFEAALEEECSHVIFADNSTKLASKALALISKGYGEFLDIYVGDQVYYKNFQILRPLKNHLSKEVLLAVRFEKFNVLPQKVFFPIKRSSIDKLTEMFIADLDGTFPSTASTVVRTCQKLNCTRNSVSMDMCSFCKFHVVEIPNSNCYSCTVLVKEINNL
jgi:hypothetical protein